MLKAGVGGWGWGGEGGGEGSVFVQLIIIPLAVQNKCFREVAGHSGEGQKPWLCLPAVWACAISITSLNANYSVWKPFLVIYSSNNSGILFYLLTQNKLDWDF